MNIYLATRSIFAFGLLAFGVILWQQTNSSNASNYAQHTPAAVSNAQSSLVTLPTITVRPSAEEIAAAMNNGSDGIVSEHPTVPHAPSVKSSMTMLRLNWDMPYYSFGNVLPRVSKD